MKKLMLSMAITAGLAGSAIAADLPVKSPRIAAAPVVMTNWTGCYVGAGFGYGMWNQDHYRASPNTLVAITPTATAGGRGWLGTAQVFLLGLTLGWFRWASGSTLLTIGMHILINLESMIETVYGIGYRFTEQ